MPTNHQPNRPSDMPRDAIRRDARLAVREVDGAQKVSASVSSDKPIADYMWWNGDYQRVYLSLDHSPDAIDREYIADGLVIRDGHYGDQIGLIPDPVIADGKLGGEIVWCSGERAENIGRDCAAKLRRSMSIEARILETEQTGERDGVPEIVARKWQPTGAAITSNAPADASVGIMREQHTQTATKPLEREITNMPNEPETPKVEPVAPVVVTRDHAAEIAEITELAHIHGVPFERTQKAIREKETPESFRSFLLREHLATKTAPTGQQTVEDAPTFAQRDLAKYDILRAIRCVMPVNEGGFAGNCLERELSGEMAKAIGREARGVFIPHQAIARTLSSTTGTVTSGTGANLIADGYRPGEFIGMLRNRTVLGRLGARMMGGLVGNVAIPKQTSDVTSYWVGEDGAPTVSIPAFGQLKATPHTVGAVSDISRLMLKQSDPSVQQFVADSIMASIGLAVDKVAISGSGINGEPKGLIYADDINTPTVTAGTPTWAQILSYVSDIQADNADIGDMAWLTTPAGWAKLAASTKDSGSGQFILDVASKTMAGIRYEVSNQAVAKTLTLGVWSQLMLCMWGALDLTVDPYKYSDTGAVRLVGLQDCDVIVRHGKSFAYQTILS